jgi:hypothetical protein
MRVVEERVAQKESGGDATYNATVFTPGRKTPIRHVDCWVLIFAHNENAWLMSSRCSSSWMAWEPVAVLADASRPA